ncbi:hypothetical protein D3Z38_03785 [Clostridiales bacterium]|nr:hypothetical protein [Clostridiales bacterium]
MKKEDRDMLYDTLKNILEGFNTKQNIQKISKALKENAELEASPNVTEFAESLKMMIGELIAQACEMAGLVYQHHCVEGRSMAETASVMNTDEKTLWLMTQYYDLKNAEKESKDYNHYVTQAT